MNGFLKGLKAYAGSFQLISELKLWTYFIIPILISVITAAIICFTAYGLSDDIGNYIASFWSWEWGKETFETISSYFGGFLVLGFGLLIFKHIILALSAPFMGPISKKIEDHFTNGNSVEITSNSFQLLIRGVRIGLRNLFRELILTIPILLFGLIPLVGVFSTVLLFLMQAYFAGFGNMDYTLERHFNYRDSVNFVKRNRGIATGNGVVFMLFLLIPFIGVILVLPLSVTAAATETIQLIQQEKNNER